MAGEVSTLPAGYTLDAPQLPVGYTLDQSFMQRVGSDIGNDVTTAQNIVAKGDEGIANITAPIEAGIKVAWSPINSVAKEAMSSAAPAMQWINDKIVPDTYKRGVETMMNAATPAAKYVSEKYSQLPAPVQNIGNAIGTTLEGVGNVASAEGVLGAARGGLNAASDYTANLPIKIGDASNQSLTLAQQAAKDKAAASIGYNGQADIPFSQDQVQGLKDNLSSLIPKRDASLRAWNSTAASGHVNDLLQSMETEPLTFDGALAQRSAINDSWSAATRAGKSAEANQINLVKDALDKTMVNPDTGSWQAANRQFGIAATKQDFSDMVDSAFDKAQPANSLDTSIGKYLNSWRGKTLTDGERSILEKLTQNSFGKELKKNIAGRLTSAVATGVGSAVGGVPGAVAGDLLGTFASKIARDSAMADKVTGLQKFFDEMDKRPMPSIPQAVPAPAAPLQLTGPGAQMAVDSLGNVSQTPNPAHEIVNAQSRPIVGTQSEPTPARKPPVLQIPPKEQMSKLPYTPAQNALARLANAARGNTDQPLLSGQSIEMRPANQLTIGVKGNLGTQLILKTKEMAAQGKSPLEIDQYIRNTLKNRKK
jgi:hypothetical protein